MTLSRTNSKEISGRIYWVIASIILLVAAIMRVRAYEPTGYWLDELYSMNITNSGSITEIFRAILDTDDNPPLYYLVLAAWRWAVGSSELVTRSLSLLFSWLAVFVLAFSRKALGSPVALGAAGLLAVLPGALYPVEARPYGLSLFLATLVVVIWIILLQAPPRAVSKVLITWVVVAALLSITHYFGALLVAALTVVAVLLWRQLDIKAPLSRFVLLTMVSFVPLILWVLFTRDSLIERSGGSHWLQAPPPTMSIDFLGWVVGGTLFSAVLIGLAIATLLSLIVQWQELGQEKFLVVGLTMALSIVLLASQLISMWTPIWLDKYGVVLIPAGVVLVSLSAYLVVFPRLVVFSVVILSIVAGVLIVNRDPRPVIPVEGWREALFEAHRLASGSTVYISDEFSYKMWSAYPVTEKTPVKLAQLPDAFSVDTKEVSTSRVVLVSSYSPPIETLKDLDASRFCKRLAVISDESFASYLCRFSGG